MMKVMVNSVKMICGKEQKCMGWKLVMTSNEAVTLNNICLNSLVG